MAEQGENQETSAPPANKNASGHAAQQSESEVQNQKLKDKAKKAEEAKMDKRKRDQMAAAQREQLLAARNQAYVVNYLERKTRFDKEQIRALQKMYRAFKNPNQKDIDRLRFREMVASLLGVTDNVMLDRIFNAFDGDNEGSVSESEWIIGLSVQLRGSLEQQTAYCYDVYDFNGDRGLGREEIFTCLNRFLHVLPGILEGDEMDDAINELVELSMRKFDINHDLAIKYSEYRHIVKHDPLLLEAFGECLPAERAALPLMALLDSNPRTYSYYLSPPGDPAWTKEKERYINYKINALHEDYVQDLEADEGKNVSPVVSSITNTTNVTNQPENKEQQKRNSAPPELLPRKGKGGRKQGGNRHF